MTIKNATPHALHIRSASGDMLTLPPTHPPVRVAQTRTAAGSVEIDGRAVEVSTMTLGGVEGCDALDLHAGDVVIMSLLAATAIREQAATLSLPASVQVCAPGAAAIRDAEGRVVGADGLSLVYETGAEPAPAGRAIMLPAGVAADVAAYGGDTPPPNQGAERLQDWLWGTFRDLANARPAPAARLTRADLPPALREVLANADYWRRHGGSAYLDEVSANQALTAIEADLRALVSEE